MTNIVRIPPTLRAFTGGADKVQAEGATVGEVFSSLFAQYPDLKPKVIDANHDVFRYLKIHVGEDDISFYGNLDMPVNDGQEVSILAAVAGG